MFSATKGQQSVLLYFLVNRKFFGMISPRNDFQLFVYLFEFLFMDKVLFLSHSTARGSRPTYACQKCLPGLQPSYTTLILTLDAATSLLSKLGDFSRALCIFSWLWLEETHLGRDQL